MKILTFLMAVLLAGCGAKLRPDPLPIDALDAGYPEAEFVVAGKRHKGMAIVPVGPGQSLDELAASVQTYFKGSIRIDSKRCDIEASRSYSRTALSPMGLTGPAKQSCVVTFLVTPELPQQTGSEQIVRGFRGHLLVKMVQPGDVWSGSVVMSSTMPSLLKEVVVAPNEQVRWVASGCGLTVQKSLTADANGIVSFDLAEAIEMKKQTCVIESAIFGSKSAYMTVFVSLYDQKYSPIPAALLTDDDEKNLVCAESDPAVSLMAVEQESGIFYRVANEGCLTFDHTRPGIFRALTVKGRTSVIEYTPGMGWLEVR